MSTENSVINKIISEVDKHKYALQIDDLKKVSESQNSLEKLKFIYPLIDLVYVLSGRGSALKKPIDHATVADVEDDYHRMLKGVKIANKIYRITGKRVPIFYNGRKLHNEHLKIAIEQGVFNYPKGFFIIRSISPENTIGQAKSFKKFLKAENYSTIAIVSSTYHLPRISRTFGEGSPTIAEDDNHLEPKKTSISCKMEFSFILKERWISMLARTLEPNNIEKANFLLFGTDRDFQRPGIEKDVWGEIEAMKKYSSGDQPSILRTQGNNTFLNKTDLLFLWSFNLQKEQMKLLEPSRMPAGINLKANDLNLRSSVNERKEGKDNKAASQRVLRQKPKLSPQLK